MPHFWRFKNSPGGFCFSANLCFRIRHFLIRQFYDLIRQFCDLIYQQISRNFNHHQQPTQSLETSTIMSHDIKQLNVIINVMWRRNFGARITTSTIRMHISRVFYWIIQENCIVMERSMYWIEYWLWNKCMDLMAII